MKRGDSHLKQNSLISTTSWLPFLTPTQSRFSLTYLLWPPLGVFALHSLLLYSDMPPPRPPSFRLAQAIFEPNLFPYKYPNNLISVILPTYIAYEDRTECSETSAYKIQTLGNHPKERIQHMYPCPCYVRYIREAEV